MIAYSSVPPAAFDPATAAGSFRISASDFYAEPVVPPLADRLNRVAPLLRAHLLDPVPSNYVDSLERYNADIALIPDMELPDWINREPLFHSAFAVIARSAKAIWHRKHGNAPLAKWMREQVFDLLKPLDVTGFAPADGETV